MQDISATLVTERAGKVLDLIRDPTQISLSGFQNCTLFLLNTIEIDLSLSSSVIPSIFSAFSALIQADSYNLVSPYFLNKIINLTKILSLYYQNSLVSGQTVTPFIDPNGRDFFRVLNKNFFVSVITNTSIVSPTSSFEHYKGITSSATIMTSLIPFNCPTGQESLGFYTIQFARNIMKIPVTNWSFIDFSYTPSANTVSKMAGSIVSIVTIQNYSPQNYTTGYETYINGTVNCYSSPNPYSVDIPCTVNTKTVTCRGEPGVMNYNCSR